MPFVDYQALYRKYRPQLFGEVVGQTHVTNTLSREVEDEKVAHAYLFAGPRGTGKTTSARILAKALNCQNPPGTGEPCNECSSCEAVTNGSSFDVTELDAASHNSVDDIRDIKLSVTTVASVGGAKRVFILDEAHMLSKAAGNALLKTLEEPPEHVHFVLATTEPYKLLDTIRSRSQRFDFHPVSHEVLVEHLNKISGLEGYEVDADALSQVARHAKGSVRDSLSLLEQVAALGGGTINVAGVNRALGLADRDTYMQLAGAIADADAKIALTLVARLAADGVDLRRFIAEAIAFFRGVFLAHYSPNLEEVSDDPAETLDDWRKVAEFLVPQDVVRTIDLLSEGLIRLREGREERLMTELTLLKAVRPEVAENVLALATRVERLEQRIARIVRDAQDGKLTSADAPAVEAEVSKPVSEPIVTSSAPELAPEPAPTLAAVPDPEPEPVADDAPFETTPSVVPEPVAPQPVAAQQASAPSSGESVSLSAFTSAWPSIVAQVRESLGLRREALLREAKPGGVAGDTVILQISPHLGFHLAQLQSDEQVAQVVGEKASEALGANVRVRFESGDKPIEVVEEREVVVDKNDLEPADSAGDDAIALVEDLLGGEVIEEMHNDE